MRWSGWLITSLIVAWPGVVPAHAQETARIQVELVGDGTVLARTQLRLAEGREGTFVFADTSKGPEVRIAVTPTFRADHIVLALHFAGRVSARTTLVLSDSRPGVVEVATDGGPPLRLTLSWMR